MQQSEPPVREAPEPFTYDPEVARSTSASGFLLDALRRRPAGRAVVSGLTVLLFLAGGGMFSYPFFTDVYTERFVQGRLDDEFRGLEVDDIDAWEASVSSGDALTRISIPGIDVDTLVVSGTSPAALRAGAGHYPNTPLPGQVGNVGIAGHRTTYGRPFNRVDELSVGDKIWLQTPIGDFRYKVVEPPTDGDCQAYDGTPDSAACITHPRDWEVVSPTDDAVLTLTTCHPKGSAAQRMVVRAELADSHAPGTYAERNGTSDDGEDGDEAAEQAIVPPLSRPAA
jgi:sortase A